MHYDVLDRMAEAVEKIKDRLRRAASALDSAGVPYAVVGGHAVGSWVARTNPVAVRTTADVDILLDRRDLETAKEALAVAGFHFCHVAGVSFFQDGPNAKFEDSVHLVFAGEKIRDEYALPAPSVEESDAAPEAFRVIGFQALVRMKLTSYRLKDRVHLQDMLRLELLDETWMEKVPPSLAPRMREVLDNPEG